ncbi:pilus assembly protein [Rhodobacterales bacterium HKCCE3408]|nr:pilus assembly protein [Rhodobacterales bacterium HKCCE3408]
MLRPVRIFVRNERAAVALEAIIMTPILAWLFTASFIFFDAFRTYNTSLKATYAIADVLSRQTDLVYGSDIEGLANIFQHISRNPGGSSMRVSEIRWDADAGSDGEYAVDWSYPTGGETRLRDSDIPNIIDQLPVMANGERVIVVETFVPYDPYFTVGIDDIEFTNFTVTRPRFAGQLPFDDGSNPSCTSCNWGENQTTTDGTNPLNEGIL